MREERGAGKQGEGGEGRGSLRLPGVCAERPVRKAVPAVGQLRAAACRLLPPTQHPDQDILCVTRRLFETLRSCNAIASAQLQGY